MLCSEYPLQGIRFEEIRAEEDEEDLISSRLPDCLLGEILSRLPNTKYAVRTGVLSKRWKNVWTLVPVLIFKHRVINPNANFVSFVDKILTQRGQLKLKKLNVYCTYNVRFEPQLHDWIRYAINCNVEEIKMVLCNVERPYAFLLDQSFFMNSCFTDLNLSVCQFKPAGAIRWENLLSLRISFMNLDEDLIENILSGTPVLETFGLHKCFGFRRLNITSKSVKKLVLEGYIHISDVIEINALTILSLAVKAYLHRKKLLLIKVPSLVEAELEFKRFGILPEISKEDEEEMLKQFMLDLRHVKEVKIGTYCSEVLSRLEAKGFTFPSNLKVCGDISYHDPFESDSDTDESTDSEVLSSDDSPTDDELQEQVDATTSSSRDDDVADA